MKLRVLVAVAAATATVAAVTTLATGALASSQVTAITSGNPHIIVTTPANQQSTLGRPAVLPIRVGENGNAKPAPQAVPTPPLYHTPTPKPRPTLYHLPPTPTPSINPLIPTGESTGPESSDVPGGQADYGCGESPNDFPWISTEGGGIVLGDYITPAPGYDVVRSEYFMWDDGTPIPNPAGVSADGSGAGNLGESLFSAGRQYTTTNFPLADGHQYTWTVAALSSVNDGSDTPASLSPDAPVCGFNVDLDAPTAPTVTSAAYPPSGSASSGEAAGGTGTFAFTSADLAPGCAGCRASGVYEFEYQLNPQTFSYQTPTPGCTADGGTVLATAGTGATASATSCPVSASLWGTNIMYVWAIDRAGNVSQATAYYFYTPSS